MLLLWQILYTFHYIFIKMICTWKSTSECLKIFKAIQHTNPMINIHFNNDHCYVISMDQSKTSLVKLKLNSDTFASYRCDRPLTLGLYTETLTNILQKAKKSNVVWKATDNTLSIVLVNNDQKTEFCLRAIDIEEEELDIPEMVDDVAIAVRPEVLRDWMDKLLMSKSDITFNISQENLICSSQSTELGTITHTEPTQGERCNMISWVKNVSVTLSYHATKSMYAFSSCGQDTCSLGFSQEMPSRLKVNIGENSYLCLYVAPKIIED